LRSLDSLEVRGPCRVSRCKFQMRHGRLGPIEVAWGSSTLDGKGALLLAVKAEGADPTLTLHLHQSNSSDNGPGNE
jgi:hypothetical protein